MEWIPFQELDFTDDTIQHISIDTRDFHGFVKHDKENTSKSELLILNKYPTMFYTLSDIKDVLDDLYKRSGGKGLLYFKNSPWIKYIRARRLEDGRFIMGFSLLEKVRFCKKGFWQQELEKDFRNKN